MSESNDGLSIARERIAREARDKTGFVDLGMLGLAERPSELLELRHLRRLCLGSQWINEAGAWVEAASDIARNKLDGQLARLATLPRLETLFCNAAELSSFVGCAGLSGLQSLDCSGTQVSDLGSLAGLSGLQSLDCSGTQVSDLGPLAGLSGLQSLDCSECSLKRIPEGMWQKSSLEEVYLFNTLLPGIPAEVLSQEPYENCLESLRAHFRDLAAGATTLTDIKLIVLGNGRVGKTQICRRWRGEDYDQGVPSTHGVVVTSAPLRGPSAERLATLHIWDFGGQDIYHGTHALFMRSRAMFLIAWAREAESSSEHIWEGVPFRNQPLPYWLESVRYLAAADSPTLIVQTRCDRLEDEVRPLPVPLDTLASLPAHWELHYSALKDRGRAGLDEALREAVDRLRERDGAAIIGKGRFQLKQRLEELRDADARVPPDERQYRTISQAHFRQLCEEAGGVSSPAHLLEYLHNAGIVFYRPGLFDDRIIPGPGLGTPSNLRGLQSGELLSTAPPLARPFSPFTIGTVDLARILGCRAGSVSRDDAVLRYLLRAPSLARGRS